MPEHIYPWLFQPGHFERAFAVFSALSVKYKPSKISSKYYVTKLSNKMKASSKIWIKWGLTAPPKPLVAVGELHCDFRQHQK